VTKRRTGLGLAHDCVCDVLVMSSPRLPQRSERGAQLV
jgi:hypothetical protein